MTATVGSSAPRLEPTAPAGAAGDRPTRGASIVADRIEVRSADGASVLGPVTMAARPGELVAIVGASGAGKSTLLRALAGDVDIAAGAVLVDGMPGRVDRRSIGFVPQTDDLPDALPLGRMLRYGARLRLPRGTSNARAAAAVDRALDLVELSDAAATPVAQLSGGQRRRASIALELVAEPRACLLDEPTSGLDPATARTITAELRDLADRGATVAFATHHAPDLAVCDRIVVVARGGRIGFDGTLDEARRATGEDDVAAVHRALLDRPVGDAPPPPSTQLPATTAVDPESSGGARVPAPVRASRIRQWWTLTLRSLDGIGRNRLTLGIMIGSPAMVIAMFAILFQRGAFAADQTSPTSAIMIAFWIVFGGFFFGLTYGLLQIVPEVAVMRRERRAGVGAGVQIAAKLAALTPVLVAIDVAMLGILRWLDRLPALSLSASTTLAVTLVLDAIAALALGLLASAAVTNPAQASLALPMLCFPAVLFSGAILPVPVMAPAGRWISAAMPDRWAFEAIGRDLGLRELLADADGELGSALLVEFGDTWTLSHAAAWVTLVGFAAGFAALAWWVLERRCRPAGRTSSDVGRAA